MATAGQIARRTGANIARATRRIAGRVQLPAAGRAWVIVRVGTGTEEVAAPHFPLGREQMLSLLDVLDVLEAVAQDPLVDGVLLRFEGSPAGWSKTLTLRRAVQRLRECGKRVAAWGESYDAFSLIVATAADRVWLPESGGVFLVGLRVEPFFLRGLLDRVGLRPEVVHVGRYKSAGERFTRDSMSPEEREQLESLVDDLFDALVDSIATGRGIEPSAARDLVDRGPYNARAAVEAGLADATLYPDELEEALSELAPSQAPDPPGVTLVEGISYHALRARDVGWRPLFRAIPRIAYVVARGAIHRGQSARGIASDTVRRLLEKLRRDEETRGVVLRIDSPGGEPTASDLIWRAVQQLAQEKPVVASMGDVAASGGYYVAAGADAVLAEATTVTGSIGVVGGKLNVGPLYERLGVHKEAISRGARSGILTESRGFTSDERAAVRGEMQSMYEIFLDRVAKGRDLAPEELDRAAHGRVVSGVRARSLGLVDSLGGPLEALLEVRRKAGLGDEERVLVDIHPRLPHALSLRPILRWIPRRIVIP